MKTTPIRKENGLLIGFEISSGLTSVREIKRILSRAPEITELKKHPQFLGLFTWKTDDRIEFKFQELEYAVHEPFGDSSVYWIGPKNIENNIEKYAAATEAIHELFLKQQFSARNIAVILICSMLLGWLLLSDIFKEIPVFGTLLGIVIIASLKSEIENRRNKER